MKVNQSGSHPTQGAEISKQGSRVAHSSGAKQSGNANSSSSVEKVDHGDARTEVSSKGKEMAQAKKVAVGTPDVREDRVADLKKRISEGTYKVEAEGIADRLVEDHARMPGL